MLEAEFKVEGSKVFEAYIEPCLPGDWQYEYSLTDHLGNTRVIFAGHNSTAKIMQQLHLYPYGMSMTGQWDKSYKHDYNYKILGSERHLDFNLDLDLHPFRGRLTDHPIWISPEPLAESFANISPYAVNGLNPISNIDPLGLDWFRNTETGEVYWEDRDKDGIKDGEEYVGAVYLKESENGYVLHYQKEVVGTYSKSTAVEDYKPSQGGEQGSLSDKFFNSTYYGGLLFGAVENSIYSRNMFTGTEIWHGKTTGHYYNSNVHNWGAYKGSKTLAINQSGPFRIGSGILFGISTTLSFGDMILNPTPMNIVSNGVNITASALATYGGPYGMVAGYGYLGINAYTKFMINNMNNGRASYNSNMMNNYIGGLSPTPLIKR